MKRTILLFFLLLTGCFGPETLDATNDATVKNSVQKMLEELPESKRGEFQKAIMYFSLGGGKGVKSLVGAVLSGGKSTSTELAPFINIQSIDGLTSDQILTKYHERLAEDNAIREREMAEKQKVRSLISNAEELLKSNKFKEAIAKYEALSELPSGREEAQEGIERTTQAMRDFAEKADYMSKVEITEFFARRIDTYSDKGVPAVRISLKNTGNRSLDKVEVVVYFQDKSGNTIYEKDFLPVLVSRYSFSGDNKPLKPGYIQEMEKGKYYTIDSALSEWEEGKATIKVTDIKFTP
ncbi:DUF6694 family lipoprotein [Hahella sp. HN01]|uniref:DUF6694 family lipoprotein n=1 Tax=Hahella sp. HN01 TaxID=2847262 RepID=UPI001C1EB738|nr:DUF6694 family lipoprotein [Hahella sp. HN01]MBU6955620.1 hypothetical protein [Hahella sp. HN01]